MLLITELNEEMRQVVEEKDGQKKYFIEGVWMQSNIVNRNGRRYPLPIMEREVDRYREQYINRNRAFGELGHPAGPTINLDRVSHMIVSLQREGNDFIGRAKINDNPMGRMVKGLIDEGAQLGVSTRGMGTLREARDGVLEVQEDFMLATAGDIVANPSAPGAFVRGIMEGVEWVWDNGLLREQRIDQYRQHIEKGARQGLSEQAALEVFQQFLSDLAKK